MDQNEEQNLETTQEEQSTTETPLENQGEQSTTAQDLVDLAQYSRVKLGDKEWNREDLEKGVMFQSDYTKKTQEIAQERRYIDNLQQDLKSVAQNPALAAEFRRIYPAKYHGYLEYVSKGTNGQVPGQGATNTNQNVDPRLDTLMSTVEMLKNERQEERVSQKATEIDAAFSKFASKYPLSTPNGDETFVLSKAQAVLENGGKLDDSTWEKIFKEANGHFERAYQGYYKTVNNKQKAAHVRGKDIAAGGGTPGGAPNLPKNIKDATKMALQDLQK